MPSGREAAKVAGEETASPRIQGSRWLRLRYGAAIFTGAFLLFQVQPLLGQAILPRFGGAAGVWTVCLLFFQTLLLIGYAGAHLLSGLRPASQAVLHGVALAAAIAFLPILPDPGGAASGTGSPVLGILGLLLTCVGVPYLVLATTGPLLQSWYNRETGAMPYRYYALSNAGSLLGLLAYPFLVQPAFDLPAQSLAWSVGFAIYAASMLACAVGFARSPRSSGWGLGPEGFAPVDPETGLPAGGVAVLPAAPPRRSTVLLWIALPAAASILLLGITNQITSEVAAVPFLWVLPLALYLITFILAFERPQWYSRRILAGVFLVGLLGYTPLVAVIFPPHWWKPILFGSVALFSGAWICHGELVRLRPHPRYLTRFYLTLSAGGALGGLLVALVAPMLFPDYWEVPIGLFIVWLLLVTALHRDPASGLHGGRPASAWRWIMAGTGLLGPVLFAFPLWRLGDYTSQERNFYGVIQIREEHRGLPNASRSLLHGNTRHGLQFLSPERRSAPTTYFGAGSGVALALEHHPHREGGDPLEVGVVGLGVGTVAAWAQEGDVFRFYELDPAVDRAARSRFTFLEDSPGEIEVVLGDGRLSLERERALGRLFDVLVVDAFSGGSIPTHLLTRECFALYRSMLRADGVLAVHVSNKYLDLPRVARAGALASGLTPVRVDQVPDPSTARDGNTWVLASADAAFFNVPEVKARLHPWKDGATPVLWTDRRTSLTQVIR